MISISSAVSQAMDQPETRVAIIGAGIGGAFTAHWLRNHTTGTRLQIDVYESAARIGGRTLDTSALGEPAEQAVELGASSNRRESNQRAE